MRMRSKSKKREASPSPRRASYHSIQSLQVNGGFLDGLKLDFSDGLNCIIGGRGTGKTTVIELIRFALGKEPEHIVDEDRFNAVERLVRHNLKDGAAVVNVKTKDGQLLSIQRSAEDDSPLASNDEGEQIPYSPNRGILFNAEIYSQDEIEEIAEDPLIQLDLIDKFAVQDLSHIGDQISAVTKDIRQNALEILRAKGEIESLKDKVGGLPEITERLKAFQLGGGEKAQALRKGIELKSVREKEVRFLAEAGESFATTSAEIRGMAEPAEDAVNEAFDSAILTGPNKTLMQKCKAECDGAASEAKRNLVAAAEVLGKMSARIEQYKTALQTHHAVQEKQYREVLSAHQKEKAQAQEREQLIRRQNALLLDNKKLERAQSVLGQKTKERQQLLADLSGLRDERYRIREGIAKRLTGQLPAIRISVEQFGDAEPYEQLLTTALKRSGLQYTKIVERAKRAIPPGKLAEWIETGNMPTIKEQLDIDDIQAKKFIVAFQGKQELYDLQAVELHDRPTIELRDGESFKEASLLSTGQRCSTILPILLLRSESPLVIDQPENNLDNAFIYEAVVKTVHGMRGKRQFIFVTHNPNIPVLGEAGAVIHMDADGQKGWKKKAGDVNAMKGTIEDLLEGGKKAFQLRYEKYGY